MQDAAYIISLASIPVLAAIISLVIAWIWGD